MASNRNQPRHPFRQANESSKTTTRHHLSQTYSRKNKTTELLALNDEESIQLFMTPRTSKAAPSLLSSY